ncbi:MAG: MBL fold metallo-hydrolase, partial [Deltaproteobacteria bacterium]|nr:MBL fold metallo-hydrolase [Deltaproteobacteria bacterium]
MSMRTRVQSIVAIGLTTWAMAGCSDDSRSRPDVSRRAAVVDSPPVATPPVEPAPVAAVSDARIDAPKLVVLGIAQDAGVPQAGCDCAQCRAAAEHPAARPRVASVALVLGDGRVFVVDATPDLPWQLRDVAALRGDPVGGRSRRPVDGIALTHGHMGHYLGLAHLGFEAAHADGVPVYGTASMLELLRSNVPWSQLVARQEIDLRPLSPGEALVLGSVTMIPVAVPHRAEHTNTVGFRFEGPRRTALYIPDCAPWSRWDPRRREALLDGVDVALLDGTFYSGDELPGRDLSAIGHPLIVDTMDWIDAR